MLPITASASFRHAFTEPVNLSVILPLLVISIAAGVASLSRFNFVLIGTFLLSLCLLLYFIWAVTSRSLHIEGEGINYTEALLKRFFYWNRIEGILIERWKKQITLQQNGKRVRIHYIGVNLEQYAEFDEAFLHQAIKHEIPYLDVWHSILGNIVISDQGIGTISRYREIFIDWSKIKYITLEQNSRRIIVNVAEDEIEMRYLGIGSSQVIMFENSLLSLTQKHRIAFNVI